MEVKTLSNFNNITKIDFGEKIVVFKFGGDWCAPCKKVEEIIKNNKDCVLYNISVDNPEFESYLMENNIYKIPHCFLRYKNRNTDFKGEITEEDLKYIIKSLKTVATS